MKKTLLYLFLLVALGFGVYYFIFSNTDQVFSQKEAGFTLEDTAAIHQIYMVRTNGEAVRLTRTKEGWLLNNKYPAHLSTVNILLKTLKLQEAQFPVPEQAHNGVVKSLAGNSVKVEIYDSKLQKMRTFYVGSENQKVNGTFMLMEGAEQAYVVSEKAFEGYLSPIYSTNEDDWRSKNIFHFPPELIRLVATTYPQMPQYSFTIENGQAPKVVADAKTINGRPLQMKRVQSYLKFFDNVNCEGYLNGFPHIDSIISHTPKVCNIKVLATNGKEQMIDIYYMPINKRSKNLALPNPGYYDQERFYAVFNNFKDTAIVQNQTFDKLMRNAAEFFEVDSTTTTATKP